MRDLLQIPGFELLGKIGRGGMAEVWRARQISLDRVVAVKFLNPQASCNPGDHDRLLAEAHAAAHLKHPGIVQVYDAGIADGIPYFVMEYIAGYSVGQWLRRKKVLPVDDALVVVEYVAQALNYAWKTSAIIHCDIKPDNIMVDLDGAIKVADLGLARSIEALKNEPGEKVEVMGTPGYISPEQSGGILDLDCRTDIYSLGATLYHLTTGKRMFESHSDTAAMDLQVTGHVADPLLQRPDLPLGYAWLMDKMLVKDRKYRYPDWDAVLIDIDRAKNGDLPKRPFPVTGTSTITRSDKRERMTREWMQQKHFQEIRRTWMRRIPMVAAVLVMALLSLFILLQSRGRRDPTPRVSAVEPAAPPVADGITPPNTDASSEEQDAARDLYIYVMDWMKQNPGRHEEAIRRLSHVAEETRGTKYSLMAEDAIAFLRDSRRVAIENTWEEIMAEVDSLVASQQYQQAVRYALEYDGPWREELQQSLQTRAVELQRRAAAYEAERERAAEETDRRLRTHIDEVSDILLTGSIEDALAYVEPHAEEPAPELERHQQELVDLVNVLQAALALDDEVLASFIPQTGEELTILFDDGPKTYFVRAIRDDRLRLERRLEGGARVEFEYGVQDLAVEEYLARLGDRDRDDVALLAGWHAYRNHDFAEAADCFAKTHPLLATPLTVRVTEAHREQQEDEARREFDRLLQTLEVEARPPDHAGILHSVRELDAGQIPVSLREWAQRFQETHAGTGFLEKVAPVLETLRAYDDPAEDGDDASETGVPAGMIDERDLNAVVEMLQNRNYGLRQRDIKILRDENQRAYGIHIKSDALRDIGPLASLGELRALILEGGEIQDISVLSGFSGLRELSIENCKSRDFQPLRQLQLRKLALPGSSFSDLSILRGMPLRELNLNHTALRDIQRLREFSLQTLELENTRVFALRELRGMPLERLNLAGTQIRNISVLQDMPLQSLNLARTSVFDFSVIRSMNLRSLNVAQTQFRDLSLLEGMPLQELDLSGTRVSDLRVLRDLPLRSLGLRDTAVRDLTPLQGAILQELFIDQCRYVRDLEFTEGMPLHVLSISGSGVTSLKPLRAPGLHTLFMENTGIENIRPLRQMPIRQLFLRGSPIRDYSPLTALPLQVLTVDNPYDGSVQPVLWRIRTLHRVNNRPWPPQP